MFSKNKSLFLQMDEENFNEALAQISALGNEMVSNELLWRSNPWLAFGTGESIDDDHPSGFSPAAFWKHTKGIANNYDEAVELLRLQREWEVLSLCMHRCFLFLQTDLSIQIGQRLACLQEGYFAIQVHDRGRSVGGRDVEQTSGSPHGAPRRRKIFICPGLGGVFV